METNIQFSQNHNDFEEMISIIVTSRNRALKAVNSEMITMYFNLGKYLSELCARSSFGDKVIDDAAEYINRTVPQPKGFNRRSLYRMKQFYETYKDDEIVSPLVTQISWTNNLVIMSRAKSAEERHFYIDLCIKEHYSNANSKGRSTARITNAICFHLIKQGRNRYRGIYANHFSTPTFSTF